MLDTPKSGRNWTRPSLKGRGTSDLLHGDVKALNGARYVDHVQHAGDD